MVFADSYGPNDILAISYLRALQKYPEIKPISILRTSDYHSDTLDNGLQVPKQSELLLKNQNITNFTPMKDLKIPFSKLE